METLARHTEFVTSSDQPKHRSTGYESLSQTKMGVSAKVTGTKCPSA